MNKEISEESVMYVASQMPTVVTKSEYDYLRTDIRLFNLRDKSNDEETIVDLAKQWFKIGKENFPYLSRLSEAVCTLFHGNSDAERQIGKSHDIDDDEKETRCRVSGFLKLIFSQEV